MATGAMKWFAQGLHDLGNKIHDLDNDDWRMGIVTGVTPAVNTPAPHWGGTGTTNYSTSQVSTAGTSYTGPIVLTAEAWSLTTTGAAMDFADINLAQDASGFTNGGYGIIYNNTDANKRAIGYIELSADDSASLLTQAMTVVFNPAGTLTLSQASTYIESTAADVVLTHADAVATAADRAQTSLDAAAAAQSAQTITQVQTVVDNMPAINEVASNIVSITGAVGYAITAVNSANNAAISENNAATSAASFAVNFAQMATSLINTQTVMAEHIAFA